MKLYRLIWVLLKHALHGRFRDEVFVSILLDNHRRTVGLVGPIVSFDWESDADAFCTINAVDTDSDPWTEHPPFGVEQVRHG